MLIRIDDAPGFVEQARAAGAAGLARKDEADSLIGALSDAAGAPHTA